MLDWRQINKEKYVKEIKVIKNTNRSDLPFYSSKQLILFPLPPSLNFQNVH